MAAGYTLSDKNSLFYRESIGEMGLCVKKKKSRYMGALSYPVVRGIVKSLSFQCYNRLAGAVAIPKLGALLTYTGQPGRDVNILPRV